LAKDLARVDHPHACPELTILRWRKRGRSGACGTSTRVELAPPWTPQLLAGPRKARAAPAVVQSARMRQPELQLADAAHRAVDPLQQKDPRRVELIAPAVVLHQHVQRPSRKHGGLRA